MWHQKGLMEGMNRSQLIPYIHNRLPPTCSRWFHTINIHTHFHTATVHHPPSHPHLLILVEGLSKACFMPPPLLVWNLRFMAVSATHGESNWVVSWSTRWVYLVRPERPKFFTWRGKWDVKITERKTGHLIGHLVYKYYCFCAKFIVFGCHLKNNWLKF